LNYSTYYFFFEKFNKIKNNLSCAKGAYYGIAKIIFIIIFEKLYNTKKV